MPLLPGKDARPDRRLIGVLVLACALISLGCVSTSFIVGVKRTPDGQHLVGQSLAIEFNKNLWNTLEASDRAALGATADNLKQQGWHVQTSEGGRIITASKAPVAVAALGQQGWTVSQQIQGTGVITTATFPGLALLGTTNTDHSQDFYRNLTVIIDESDPTAPHYTYKTTVVVPASTNSQAAPPPPASGSGDEAHSIAEWAGMVDQAMATAVAQDPKYQKYEQALKDAGPPKVTLGVSLPGAIQSATVNGSDSGTISGNQVQWSIPFVPGTYNIVATAGQGADKQLQAQFQYSGASEGAMDFDHANSVAVIVSYSPDQGKTTTKIEGAAVVVALDGNEIGRGETNAAGEFDMNVALPPDTPAGSTKHQFTYSAAKDGYQPVQGTEDITVARGLKRVRVTVEDSVESGVYQLGDSVTLEGDVSAVQDDGLMLSPVGAVVTAYGEQGSVSANTDADGNYTIALPVTASEDSVSKGTTTIRIEAVPGDSKNYRSGSVSVTLRISAKGTLNVSAGTDRAVYGPDESVAVAGDVMADGKPVAGTVQVVVDEVLMGTVQSGADGHYTYSFVPSSVPLHPQNPSQIPPGANTSNSGGQPRGTPIVPVGLSNSHIVRVTASAQGYVNKIDGASAYFQVSHADDECRAESMWVSGVSGNPATYRSPQFQTRLSGSNQRIDLLDPTSYLAPGGGVSQGQQVSTSGSDQATFTLLLDPNSNAQATVAVGANTTVDVVAYCRDSDGKLHVTLQVNQPGQVLVNWPPGANATLHIVTPKGAVTNVHTRFLVNVDETGTTAIATMEGTARLTDDQGASVDVDAGQEVVVPAGGSVQGASPSAIAGLVDPALTDLLNRATLPAGAGGGAALPGTPGIAFGMPRDFDGSTDTTSQGNSFVNRVALRTYAVWLFAAGVVVLLGVILLALRGRRRARRGIVVTPTGPAAPPPPTMIAPPPAGTPLPATPRFCGACGAAVPLSEARFCGQCGQPFSRG